LAAVANLRGAAADHPVPLLAQVEPGGAQLEVGRTLEHDVALQRPFVALAVEARLAALHVVDLTAAVVEGEGHAVEEQGALAVRPHALAADVKDRPLAFRGGVVEVLPDPRPHTI